MKERQSYIGSILQKHDGSGISTISLWLFYNHDTHDETKRTLSHPVDHPIHFCSYLQLLVFTIYLSSLYLIFSLGDEHETSFFILCIYWKNLLFWYAPVTLTDNYLNMPCNFSKVLKLYSSLHIQETNWSRNASHSSLQGKRRSAIGQFVFPVHSNIPAKSLCES